MIPPSPAAPFVWRDFNGYRGLVCLPLEAVAAHVFTSSIWPLGARTSGESDAWAPVARAVGVDQSRLVRVRQVHGVTVAVGGSAEGMPRPGADIVLIRSPGLAAAVQVADCAPILIADSVSGAVAAVHAGWRGMAARAPEVAIAALAREFGARPSDLVAAVGPSVGACCYEVGADVRERFADSGFDEPTLRRWFADRPVPIDGNPPMAVLDGYAGRADRWFLDGWSVTREQLVDAGVPGSRVFSPGLCTASHPSVFCSYRRDGAPSGRLAAAIRCGSRRP